ncbi:hypothetical protein [Bordetella ansorpii]|uniref:hypothetical protein n=1 Tax=Bordetella ansorpii TaxID=288768 RepID=UPI0018D4B896|nr:hypothetical protein [Bordetella ansorpii]
MSIGIAVLERRVARLAHAGVDVAWVFLVSGDAAMPPGVHVDRWRNGPRLNRAVATQFVDKDEYHAKNDESRGRA